MLVTETLNTGLKRGFTITVPEPELAEKREKRLAELGKTMQMPGFRPGKVPMSMVRKRYGSAVAAEMPKTSGSSARNSSKRSRASGEESPNSAGQCAG